MRRLISDAVQVRPAPSLNERILNPSLKEALPKDEEVRDAMAKLAAQIGETVRARIAGQDGWTVGDMYVNLVHLEDGEVALRGSVVIERAD